MRLEADDLVEPFGEFVDEYRSEMEKKAREYLILKEELKRNRNSTRAMKVAVEAIVTQGWWRTSRFDDFKTLTRKSSWDLTYLRSRPGRDAAERVYAKKGMHPFLDQIRNSSLRDWLEERYTFAAHGKEDSDLKKVKGLGRKGRDDMLRSLGYLDRVPIDLTEKRFMMRTGIFHLFSPRGESPGDYEAHHTAITDFCENILRRKYIQVRGNRIPLANAPGLFDVAVYEHYARGNGRRNICGASPKCFRQPSLCPLFGLCLWSQKQ